MSEGYTLGRVMLVDDEKIDLSIYTRILRRSGLVEDVVCFWYAEEALDYLKDPQSPPVDLILLDINMPRMTGFEFLEAAIETLGRGFEYPIVMMLTTSLNPRDKALAESFRSVRAYINKPMTVQQLQQALPYVRSPAA